MRATPTGRAARRSLWVLAVLLLATPRALAGSYHLPERVERHHLKSQAVGKRRDYLVYVPRGYAASGERRYPVLVVLHGLGGDEDDWFQHGRLHGLLDAAVAAGELPPMVVVSPDGDNGYWTNHLQRQGKEAPRWGDWVVDEVLPDVERRYRVRTDRKGRAIAGYSMGGHGAMSIGLLHRDLFGAIVSLGGALFPEAPTHRPVYGRVWGKPPDPGHWRRTSPIAILRRSEPSQAASLPAIFLQCGTEDPLGFAPYAELAAKLLRGLGARFRLVLTPGGHNWRAWRPQLPSALEFVVKRLGWRAAPDAAAPRGSSAPTPRPR